MRAQSALDDLHALLHHDQGELIPVSLRDISWQDHKMLFNLMI